MTALNGSSDRNNRLLSIAVVWKRFVDQDWVMVGSGELHELLSMPTESNALAFKRI